MFCREHHWGSIEGHSTSGVARGGKALGFAASHCANRSFPLELGVPHHFGPLARNASEGEHSLARLGDAL